MITQIYIKVKNIEKAIQFYVYEMKWFKVIHSGNAGTLIRGIKHQFLELYLELGNVNVINNDPIFAIESNDCQLDFDIIKEITFKSGGYLFKDKDEKEPSILEYPLGKNFLLIDPSGNRFLIYEDYYYGSNSDYIG
jgi:hypothetical protein